MSMDGTECIAKVLEIEYRALGNLRESIAPGVVAQAARVLHDCAGMVYVSGCGDSGAAATKIAHTFNCAGRPSAYLSPLDAAHSGYGMVRGSDVAVLISGSGESREMLRMLDGLRAKGAFILAVTQNAQSTLATAADLLLHIPIEREADPQNVMATASIICTLAVFDAITVCMMPQE